MGEADRMKRYVTLGRRPKAEWEEVATASDYLARTVFEADPTPYQTGLLDAFGEPLWAVIESDPVGFVRWTD